MDIPTPSFEEIIKNNKLINGRLNIPVKSLEKLYVALVKENARIRKKVERENNFINSHFQKRSQLNLLLKRNVESVVKSFSPSADKISLLYKKQGSSYYIKARIYWEGIQREVQIGTIPLVIKTVNSLIDHNVISDLQPINKPNMTWNAINGNTNLIQAIKEIASIKFQEYILRKLISSNDINYKEIDLKIDKDLSVPKEDFPDTEPTAIQAPNEVTSENSRDWYVQWREKNL